MLDRNTNLVEVMREDALTMTRSAFVDKYGTSNIAVWDEVTGFGWDELETDNGA